MNLLASKARAPILIFTDANVSMDLDCVGDFRRHFADPEVGCVCGSLVYTNDGASATASSGSAYWRFEEAIKKLEMESGSMMGADGSVFAIRRSLHKPPPEHIIDDMYVSLTILCSGYRVIQASDALAYEESVVSAREEFRRKIRIACQAFNVHRLLWPQLRKLDGITLYKYVSHKLIRWFTIYLLAIAAFAFDGRIDPRGACSNRRRLDRLCRGRAVAWLCLVDQAFCAVRRDHCGVCGHRVGRVALLARRTLSDMDSCRVDPEMTPPHRAIQCDAFGFRAIFRFPRTTAQRFIRRILRSLWPTAACLFVSWATETRTRCRNRPRCRLAGRYRGTAQQSARGIQRAGRLRPPSMQPRRTSGCSRTQLREHWDAVVLDGYGTGWALDRCLAYRDRSARTRASSRACIPQS